MRRRRGMPILIATALALGLVASACAEDTPTIQGGGGGGEDTGEGHEEQGTVMIAGEEATNHGSADVTGSAEFELELDDFYFGPTVLEGEAGQSLTVTMHNEGDAPHTFTIDEAGIDEQLQPGDEDVSVDVTFPDSGAAVFYCSFHRSQGMLGALSVGGDLGAGSGGEHEDESSDDSGSSGGGYNY
jgi:plastocyanin